MRHRTTRLALASIALAATALGAQPAAAEDAFRHGHIREVEPGVTLQRATETTAEEAIRNLPFLPGDRVWTDATGRTEFRFPEGTVVRLDNRSKLDYADHDESEQERVVLRLWSGSVILRTRAQESAIFDIETPGGLVEMAVPGVVRVDVEGGETRLSVYEGEASLDTGRERVAAGPGEQTQAAWGGAPSVPEPFDRYAGDAFARWDADLESQVAWAADSSRYLPEELEAYAPEFDTHGSWVYEQPVGYVWQPRVAAGWAPYTNGRWTWTAYGWTWVPYETWGWAPHHYGRWGFSVSLGWYWAPGTVWGAGWVSWGIGNGYVGWCALGPWNRPVVPWDYYRGGGRYRGYGTPRHSIGHGGNRGYAVPRGSMGHDRAWTVVKRGELGRGDIARRRVDPTGVGTLRVAESVGERPDRGVTALTRTAAVPRAAQRRPRTGASSRASRDASPVPLGSTSHGISRPSGAVGRSRPGSAPGAAAAAGTGIAGAAARARSRSGALGSATAPSVPSASRGSSATPWIGASRSRGAAGVRPRSSTGTRGENPIGSLFQSRERSSSPTRARPRAEAGSSRPAARPSQDAPRGRGTTPPPSGRSGGGVSSSPRSSPQSLGGFSGRSSGSRSRSSGASIRPRGSGSPSSGVSSHPRSDGSRSSGVSSRPRSSGSTSSGRSRAGSVSSGTRSRRPHR